MGRAAAATGDELRAGPARRGLLGMRADVQSLYFTELIFQNPIQAIFQSICDQHAITIVEVCVGQSYKPFSRAILIALLIRALRSTNPGTLSVRVVNDCHFYG